MSLDVYLQLPLDKSSLGVALDFLTDHGFAQQAEEFRLMMDTRESESEVYSANITHNLGKMAGEAGIYQHLWRPEELGIKTARELIKPVEEGLELLRSDPERFKKFDASNGWGMYEHFVPWIESYLDACKKFPDAIVEVSR